MDSMTQILNHMQLFLVDWRNNYGLGALIIEAENQEHAKDLVKEIPEVWSPYTITPLVITDIAGTTIHPNNQS